MDLHFFCQSGTPDERACSDPPCDESLVVRFDALVESVTWDPGHPPQLRIENGRAEIRFLLLQDQEQPEQFAEQLLGVLHTLSKEHKLSWTIGHQLESRLGCIVEGRVEPNLPEEMLTSIHVARSLAGMIVDDEFVEPEFDDDDDFSLPAEGESGQWNDLLQDDSFTRFPEWD